MQPYHYLSTILLFFIASPLFACSCQGLAHYDLVFEGTVLKTTIDFKERHRLRYLKIDFDVNKQFKGEPVKQISIYTGSVIKCGMAYQVGQKYQIFAIKNEVFETKYCYRGSTLAYWKIEEVIKAARDYVKKQQLNIEKSYLAKTEYFKQYSKQDFWLVTYRQRSLPLIDIKGGEIFIKIGKNGDITHAFGE